VSEWSDTFILVPLFQWTSTINIQLSVECYLFSPWYGWNIAHLALSNDHSFTKIKLAVFLSEIQFDRPQYLYEYTGQSWSWSYSCWIYNYICNQCISPLTLWVRIPLRRGVLVATLCNTKCQWLVTDWWISPCTDRHDITEILLKVALNTITLTLIPYECM